MSANAEPNSTLTVLSKCSVQSQNISFLQFIKDLNIYIISKKDEETPSFRNFLQSAY